MTITSFSDDMRQRGLTPGSRTLEFRTIPAGARLGRILHVSPSEPVLSVKRLRLADGEPMAIELLHVPEALFPGLTARDLEESSFYDLLEHRYAIEIVGGTQTVEPTVTNEEESSALGVPLHSPALLFERVTHPRAARSSSSRARSTAATATASSRSSASAAPDGADRSRPRPTSTAGSPERSSRSVG